MDYSPYSFDEQQTYVLDTAELIRRLERVAKGQLLEQKLGLAQGQGEALMEHAPSFAIVAQRDLDWLTEELDTNKGVKGWRILAEKALEEAWRLAKMEEAAKFVERVLEVEEGFAYYLVQASLEGFEDTPSDNLHDHVHEMVVAAELDLEQEEILYEKFLANLPSGGSSGGDWALGCTRRHAKEIAKELALKHPQLFPGGKYTLHHKVSQSQLKDAATRIEAAGTKANVLLQALTKVGASLLGGTTSVKKILLNLPFNLELGPPGNIRIGDPGAGFDPNPGTPRSNALSNLIARVTAENWDAAAQIILTALANHDPTGTGPLSMPLVGQWLPQGGKFVRQT